MESLAMRKNALIDWLENKCELKLLSTTPLPANASFRRYFRIQHTNGSYVAMDAPHDDNCINFIKISQALRELGLKTPEIIHANLTDRFLLLTDFGDLTYLKALTADNADKYYTIATNALLRMQECKTVANLTLARFDAAFMLKEWHWHKEWFLGKLLNLSNIDDLMLDEVLNKIVSEIASQPHVFMHRDYHSANLMVLPENDVGILDFQDAFIEGPITYDLASLLRDCYIDWPEEMVQSWVKNYYQNLSSKYLFTLEEFVYWFDLMSIQRHLKALFTFARKQIRDNESQYLKYIPRTLVYLLSVTKKYQETHALYLFLKQNVVPSWQEKCLCVG